MPMHKGQWHKVNGKMIRRNVRTALALSVPVTPRTVPDPPYDPDDPHILAACNARDVEALVNDAWQRLTLPERVNLLGFRRKTATAPAKA